MEAAVLQPPRRTKTFIKPKASRVLDDTFFIALTKEIENGLKPQNANVSGKALWDAVESGNISADVVEDFEDAVFGQILEKAINEDDGERVSREQIMKTLRRR